MSIGWAIYLAGNMLLLGYIIQIELGRFKLNKMNKILVRERLMLNEIFKRIKENPEEFTQKEINKYKFDEYLLGVREDTFNKVYFKVVNIL